MLQVLESNHNVGHLYACVVDVVLNFDILPRGAEHADKGVAQDGVAEMADVGGLIRIDVGMLDDDFFRGGGRMGALSRQKSSAVISAIQAEVQVSVSGNFNRGHTFDFADRGRNLSGDRFRSFLQLPRKLKRRWKGDFTERRLLGLLRLHRRGHTIQRFNPRAEGVRYALFEKRKHESPV